MAEYNSIRVEHGAGGFGGPLVITPTEQKTRLCLLLVAVLSLNVSRKL